MKWNKILISIHKAEEIKWNVIAKCIQCGFIDNPNRVNNSVWLPPEYVTVSAQKGAMGLSHRQLALSEHQSKSPSTVIHKDSIYMHNVGQSTTKR